MMNCSKSLVRASLKPDMVSVSLVALLTLTSSSLAQNITPVPPVSVTAPAALGLNPDGSTTASGGFFVESPSVGPFGNIPQNDVPFSLNSIPQIIIQDQQAKTEADILRNDPSIVQQASANRWGYSNFLIRGFDASNSQSNRVDGLPFTTQASELIYNYERVDIFKGTDALLYGFSNPGGVINYISKRPLDQPLTNLSFNYISPTWFGGTADISRRFGDGDQFGIRVNLASHGGDLGIKDQTNKDVLAALALDWRPLPGFRVWFNGSFSRNEYDGLSTQFTLANSSINIPIAPDTSKLYGQPFSHHIGTTDLIEGGFEGDILPWLSGHVKAGEVAGYRDVRYLDAKLIDNSGNYTLNSDPDNLWHLTDYSAEAVLSPHFDFGIVKNKMDFGATFNTETEQAYNIISSSGVGGIFNLANPYFINDQLTPHTPTFSYGGSTTFNNYVFRDTLDITKYLTLIGGVADSVTWHDDTLGSADFYSQSKVSPSGAIIVKPIDNLSIYASYIQGLQSGTQGGQTFGGAAVTNAFAYLPPFVSTQYEVGAKYNLNNALQLNAALFQITEPNAVYTANNAAGTSYTFSANGQQRNRGLEFTTVGKVYDGLRIFSGFTYLDPRIEQSQNGTLNGLNASGIPRWRGNVFGEYDIAPVPGLTVMGGYYYTGASFVNSLNTMRVPGYGTVDIGAKYKTQIGGNETTFRFYVQNIAGSNYWIALPPGGQLSLGDPRTFKVDVSMRF